MGKKSGERNEYSIDQSVFVPGKLGDVTLKNRLIRAGCFEGLAEEGHVTDRLIEHHRRLAQGGIAMTIVGYCAVAPEGRAFNEELLMQPDILPGLRKLTDEVHENGAAASIQLVHCGFFADPQVIKQKPIGASEKYCTYRMTKCREMSKEDIEQKIEDFAGAGAMARDAGFDAVEIHAGHGYLLSQFITPWTNHRKDDYGGSLENRMRFPVAVVRRLRDRLGEGFPVLVKMNQFDGFPEGIVLEEAKEVAKAFEQAGATAVIPSCGFTSRTPFAMLRGRVPIKEMAAFRENAMVRLGLKLFGKLLVQYIPYEALFLFDGSAEIQQSVGIPVIYVGGVLSADHLQKLRSSGFQFIQIGRATIRDPDFPNRIATGELQESDCDICNRCVAAMEGVGVYCVSQEEGLMKNVK